jgi:CHAT domain-containing protein
MVTIAGLRVLVLAFFLIATASAEFAHAEARAEGSSAWHPTTTPDSIQWLLTGAYFTAAEKMAARHVAAMERQFGKDSKETISPLLLRAQVLVIDDRRRAEGIVLTERIEGIVKRRGCSSFEQGVLTRLRGIAFHQQGRSAEADSCIELAMSLMAEDVGTEHPEIASTLMWKVRSLRGRGFLRDALEPLERAIEIFLRTRGENDPRLFDAWDYLARSPKFDANKAGAMELYDRVLAGFKRTIGENAPRLIATYFRMSAVYSDLGRPDKVRQFVDSGLAVAAANPDDDFLGTMMYIVAGALANEEHRYREADSLLTIAIDHMVPYLGFDGEATLWPRSDRAYARYRLGRIDEADREWEAILKVAPDSTDGFIANNLGNRALCAMARGDTDSADSLLAMSAAMSRSARDRSSSSGRAAETGWIEGSRALCHWLAGRQPEAIDLALQVERDGRDAVRRGASSLSDTDALAFERFRLDGLDLAISAVLGGGLDDPTVERVFDAVVRSRAIVLDAVTGRHIAARSGADSLLVALSDSLRRLDRRLSEVVTRAKAKSDADVATLNVERRRILAALGEHNQRIALALESESIGAARVRASLADGMRLVSFVRFNRHQEAAGSRIDDRTMTPWYAAFVSMRDSSRTRVIDLGPAAETDRGIERWRQLAAASPSPDWKALEALGDTLRARLWDPVAPMGSRGRRVFVVADGAICLLPFVALPARQGRFVLEESAAITYLSAERDLAAGPRSAARGTGLLVLGDPDFRSAVCADPRVSFAAIPDVASDEESAVQDRVFRGKTSNCAEFHDLYFSRLSQSGAEARDLASLAHHRRVPCALLVGPEASEESFKRFAPGRRMIHVASHGFALSGRCAGELGSRETPLVRAGIALAGANSRADVPIGADREDGILTAEEVAALDLSSADCVVLSACESGVGEVVTGEGVLGMRRAFHQAGAGTLVSSLWKVDDAATRAWMREFYRGLLGDHPDPVDAAHAASLETVRQLRKSGTDPSPALWGAFVVCGAPGGSPGR